MLDILIQDFSVARTIKQHVPARVEIVPKDLAKSEGSQREDENAEFLLTNTTGVLYYLKHFQQNPEGIFLYLRREEDSIADFSGSIVFSSN